MAAIPTYIYVGDFYLNGSVASGSTGIPFLWGGFYNDATFNRVVPSAPPDGWNGGTFDPYWDGGADSGNGKFVKYHYIANTFVPDAGGDNWYTFTRLPSPAGGGGITPMTMLMNALWERHPSGFKMLKQAATGGFGTQWKPGSAGYNEMLLQLGKMQAAVAPDTLDIKAVIVDCSASDANALNLNYLLDALLFINGIRADVSATCLITLVSHPKTWREASLGVTMAAIRYGNQLLADGAFDVTNVRVFDMSWAQFGPDNLTVGVPGPENTSYTSQSVIEMGVRLGRFIDAYFSPVPAAPAGGGIAVYVLVGDSNFVTANIDPAISLLTHEMSILGSVGGTTRAGQYVWDDGSRQVVLYDAIASPYFGPYATFLKRAYEKHPDGVVVFNFAIGGMALQKTAVDEQPGLSGAIQKSANLQWIDFQQQWQDFRSACFRDIGRTPDVRGFLTNVSYNDTTAAGASTTVGGAMLEFIDDIRELITTRTDGVKLAVGLVEPPPHRDNGFAHGTVHGTAVNNLAVRTALNAIPNITPRVAILHDDGETYELQRTDNVHYALEAVFNVGYDGFDLLWALNSDEGGTAVEEEATTSDTPSQTAAFTVEDGTGLPSANALVSVAYVTTYLEQQGNPSSWINASDAKRKDAIRQASRWISLRYSYQGQKVDVDQGLAFPRFELYDEDDWLVDHTSVPKYVQQAVAYCAGRIVAGDWTPFPDEVGAGTPIGGSISVGPISISEPSTAMQGGSTESRLPVVEKLLRSFLRRTSGVLGRG